MKPLGWCLIALCGCAGVEEGTAATRVGRVQGLIEAGPGAAWLFLYRSGEGYPGLPAVPTYVTAASAQRRLGGNNDFVFAQVLPNPYRLWAFVDVNGNFDPQIDVLAQPGASDRVSAGVELNLQPTKTHFEAVSITTLVEREPPAFRLEGVTGSAEIVLDTQPNSTTALTLLADNAGGKLNLKKAGFSIGLVDANHDGQPDDANADGIPDLSLQLFLRFVPRPGQVQPGSMVIVPVVVNPAPFLTTLNGSLAEHVVVDRIQGYVVPQAQELVIAPNKPLQLNPIGAPPPGQYELVVLSSNGQYWRMPNGLAGVLPEQGVRFHFDRVAP